MTKDGNGVRKVAPGIRAITAPNPGPMTHTGTQTYLIGDDPVAVVDPGPSDASHCAAILAAVGSATVTAILVTHAHRDHSEGVAALRAATSAAVLAFGPATAGRSAFMERLANRSDLGGGEGVDRAFQPDRTLADGARIAVGALEVEALHTPGHLSSHLCFAVPAAGAILTGDTVMGWSSTLISPPDGSVGAFRASMDRLAARSERLYLPGHGEPVPDGPAEARRQTAHRQAREAAIVAALTGAPRSVPDLVADIYADVPTHLHPAAARNVLAHLIDLAERGRLALPEGPLGTARFALTPT